MPFVKISQLPVGTTPSGSELIESVQSGESVQFTLAQVIASLVGTSYQPLSSNLTTLAGNDGSDLVVGGNALSSYFTSDGIQPFFINGTALIHGDIGALVQGQLALTTTGSSGAATLAGTTLNIPQYATGLTAINGTTNQIAASTTSGTTTLSLPSTVHLSTGLTVGSTGSVQWGDGGGISGATNGAIGMQSNGVFRFLDNTGGGSPSIILGSQSASWVSIKRNGTTLAVRLGDDSGDGSISASTAILSSLTASSLVKTDGSKNLVSAIAGTDYISPSNLGTGVQNALVLAANTAGAVLTNSTLGYSPIFNVPLTANLYPSSNGTAPSIPVLYVGDSITAGDTVLPAQSFPSQMQLSGFGNGAISYNAGLSGETAIQIASAIGSSQTYVGSPNPGTYVATSKLTASSIAIEGSGTNDLSAITAVAFQLNSTGNTSTASNIVSGIGSTSGANSGVYLVSYYTGAMTSNGTAPSDGDTVTIGSRVYRFKTTPAQLNDILIGVSASTALANLFAAIGQSSNTGYFAGTPINYQVASVSVTGTVLTVRQYDPFAATGLGSTASGSTLTWGSTTLTGGGAFAQGTTVTSVDSSSQVHLSANPIKTLTGANISFATETLAQWKTAQQSIWSQCRTAGAKILRWSILPRNDSNGTVSNALVASTWVTMNAWLAQQQYNGTTITSGWDAYLDFSTFPEMNQTTNSQIYSYGGSASGGIHPNVAGKAIQANAISDLAVRSFFTGTNTYPVYPFAARGIQNNWLQLDVPFTDAANTWTVAQTMNGALNSPVTPALLVSDGGAGVSALQIQSSFGEASMTLVKGSTTIWTIGTSGTALNITGFTGGGLLSLPEASSGTASLNAAILQGIGSLSLVGSDAFRPYTQYAANGGQVWQTGNDSGTYKILAHAAASINGITTGVGFLGASNAFTGMELYSGYLQIDAQTASTMTKFDSNKRLVSATAGTDYSILTIQTGTLVGGTATKTVPAGCHPWVQDNATSLTNVGTLTVTVSGTTATITSTNPLDTSPFTLFNAGSQ